jgi:hypothetical protein
MDKFVELSPPDYKFWPSPDQIRLPLLNGPDLRAALARPGWILIGWRMRRFSGPNPDYKPEYWEAYWVQKTGPRHFYYDHATAQSKHCMRPWLRIGRERVAGNLLEKHNEVSLIAVSMSFFRTDTDQRPAYLRKNLRQRKSP